MLAGNSRGAFDPRLVARYTLNDRTAFKAYAGLFHEPPLAEQLDDVFRQPAPRAKPGAPSTPASASRAEDPGSTSRSTPRSTTSTATTSPVFTQDDDDAPRRIDPAALLQQRQRRQSYSLELMVKREVTRNFYGWLSYSLSRSDDKPHPDDVGARVTAFRSDAQPDRDRELPGRTAAGSSARAFAYTTGAAVHADRRRDLRREQRRLRAGGRRSALGACHTGLRRDSTCARTRTFTFKAMAILDFYVDVINVTNQQKPRGAAVRLSVQPRPRRCAACR